MLQPLDQQRRSAIQVLKARTKAAVAVVLHGAAQHASVTTLPCEKQVTGIRWR